MKFRVPHTYVIIFALLVLCAVATWFVPGGQYVQSPEGLSYEEVPSVPQSWQVFTAIYHGFVKQAGIIVFILVVGGAFWLLNATGAVSAGIGRFIARVGHRDKWVLVGITLLFSLAGAIFGMSEETIPFVGMVVPLMLSLGYDAFMGMLIVYVAANVGFSAAFLNPFTVGIAQGMADLPLFSGMGYRIFCWAFLTLLLVVFVLLYARRCKRLEVDKVPEGKNDGRCPLDTSSTSQTPSDPDSALSSDSPDAGSLQTPLSASSSSPQDASSTPQTPSNPLKVSELATSSSHQDASSSHQTPLTRRQAWILLVLGITVVLLVVGVTVWDWYLAEITGLFLVMGIVSGLIAGFDSGRIADELIAGAKDILSAALVVGFASGIIVILQDGKVVDSILHAMQQGLDGQGPLTSLSAMYGIQAVINFLIPSASAKAAVTIPIMAPFADMVGVSRQAMVLAFQFGDGFTNMLTPTSGVLMAALAMARIPYTKWVKWVWKGTLALLALGLLLLLATALLPTF